MAVPVISASGPVSTSSVSPATLGSLVTVVSGTPITAWEWQAISTPSGLMDCRGQNASFSDGRAMDANPTMYLPLPGGYRFQVRAANAEGWGAPIQVELQALTGALVASEMEVDVSYTAVIAAVNATVPAIGTLLGSTVSTETAVACANADTALLAANPLRKNFQVYNPVGGSTLHLHLGAGAATAASFFPIPPGGLYDNQGERWQGPVRGFWDAGAAGNCLIREVT